MRFIVFATIACSSWANALPCESVDTCWKARTLSTSILKLTNQHNGSHVKHFGPEGLIVVLSEQDSEYSYKELALLSEHFNSDGLYFDFLQSAILSAPNKKHMKDALLSVQNSDLSCRGLYKTCISKTERDSRINRWVVELTDL